MAKVEVLPKGFWRSHAGSLRVQVRVKGHKVEVKSFPLFDDGPAAKARQYDEAVAWAVETRRRMRGGTHVSTREAERLTLADALRRYEDAKLDFANTNHRKDINRIRLILRDPISERSIVSLRPTDMAAYRDLLVHRGWLSSVQAALTNAKHAGADRVRIREIESLDKLRSREETEKDSVKRRAMVRQREAIEIREKIVSPARTTISNKTQLITRALAFVGEKMEGVPDLTGTPMPAASPGRERRLREGEGERLQAAAREIGSILPLGICLAIETTLRRERLLELAPKHLVKIGGGRRVIMFPREGRRRKRVGIIPVTPAILVLLDEAVRLNGRGSIEECEPGIPFLNINGNTFDHQWRSVVRACGIDDLTFHDLRHEGTSRLFEQGLTTAEVMSVTGHSTKEMVDRYSHYSASIVYDKLVDGPDPERLSREIGFLAEQFVSAGGNLQVLFANLGAWSAAIGADA